MLSRSLSKSRHTRFLGPNVMLSEIVRVMDFREIAKNKRIEILYGDMGVAGCHTSRACSYVCPKEEDGVHFLALVSEGKLIVKRRNVSK